MVASLSLLQLAMLFWTVHATPVNKLPDYYDINDDDDSVGSLSPMTTSDNFNFTTESHLIDSIKKFVDLVNEGGEDVLNKPTQVMKDIMELVAQVAFSTWQEYYATESTPLKTNPTKNLNGTSLELAGRGPNNDLVKSAEAIEATTVHGIPMMSVNGTSLELTRKGSKNEIEKAASSAEVDETNIVHDIPMTSVNKTSLELAGKGSKNEVEKRASSAEVDETNTVHDIPMTSVNKTSLELAGKGSKNEVEKRASSAEVDETNTVHDIPMTSVNKTSLELAGKGSKNEVEKPALSAEVDETNTVHNIPMTSVNKASIELAGKGSKNEVEKPASADMDNNLRDTPMTNMELQQAFFDILRLAAMLSWTVHATPINKLPENYDVNENEILDGDDNESDDIAGLLPPLETSLDYYSTSPQEAESRNSSYVMDSIDKVLRLVNTDGKDVVGETTQAEKDLMKQMAEVFFSLFGDGKTEDEDSLKPNVKMSNDGMSLELAGNDLKDSEVNVREKSTPSEEAVETTTVEDVPMTTEEPLQADEARERSDDSGSDFLRAIWDTVRSSLDFASRLIFGSDETKEKSTTDSSPSTPAAQQFTSSGIVALEEPLARHQLPSQEFDGGRDTDALYYGRGIIA